MTTRQSELPPGSEEKLRRQVPLCCCEPWDCGCWAFLAAVG